MSLYEKLAIDICYVCQKEGNNLVSPCGNDLHENIPCEIKTHRECLENTTVCPKCSNPIIINKVKKFNLYNFTKTILMGILYMLTYISGMVLPGINMMGVFIDGRKIPNDISGTVILAALLGMVTGLAYLTGFGSYYVNFKLYNNEDNSFLLKFMLLTSLIVNLFILLCHFCGFIILLIVYKTYYYNSYSFCVGLAFSVALTTALSIIGYIFYSCRNLYYNNLEEETVLGV